MIFMNALSLFILGAQKYSDIPTFVDRPYHQNTQSYFYITVFEKDTKNLLGEPSACL